MSLAIILSIVSGISIPIFMALFSNPHLKIKSGWTRYIASSCAGFILWLILLGISDSIHSNRWDLVCGGLVILCAIWANYWLGNLGGGFRINMLVILAAQREPVSFEQWMNLYGGLGMEEFLQDRLRSILIPWGIVRETNGTILLTATRGKLFGWLMNILYILLQGKRRG
jgi:hypothetical protein